MRNLTISEITALEQQGCIAEDWMCVLVLDEDFNVDCIRNVEFSGRIEIGSLYGTITTDDGLERRCGLRNACLHNVSIGDYCLIENVHGYISGYDIGSWCYISNVGVISTEGTPSFGNGNVVPVLNEGGDGNVVIYDKLTAQTAWMMIHHECVRRMVLNEVANHPIMDRGVIGESSFITNTKEIKNAIIGEFCKVSGASHLNNVTVRSSLYAPTFIGSDVILDNTVVAWGAYITDGAKIDNCFVGESVHIGKGFSAESSLFFANSHMDNGEACAAMCGPFSTSHHKSTLLIGGGFSFYNAGSATNQSNHAYKMGPIHWGTLDRGAKTASGCHILWPATIGAYSMVMGKLSCHPNLSGLPFSYVIADGQKCNVVPGINLRTVGTWRDVNKWPKRDLRLPKSRTDIINFAFPDPYTIQKVLEGNGILRQLLESDPSANEYKYQGCTIKRTALLLGMKYYDLAILLFIGNMLKSNYTATGKSDADAGITGEWIDICGMFAPKSEIDRLLKEIESGAIETTDDVLDVLRRIDSDYERNASAFAFWLMQKLEGSLFIDLDKWRNKAMEANELWVQLVCEDAEKEFAYGDVEEEQLRSFLDSVKLSAINDSLDFIINNQNITS